MKRTSKCEATKLFQGRTFVAAFGFLIILSKFKADSNMRGRWLGIICWSIVL